MEEIKVSVIMAVYNGEQTVLKSLKSVLSQDHSNLEVIVIDDGSTDSTVSIVNSIEDDRIHLVSQKNGGVSNARNKGLSAMSGDYFCFLDADDLMPSKSISSRVEVFMRDSNIVFADGVVEERDLENEKLLRRYEPTFVGEPLRELLMLKDTCFCGQTWMVKNFGKNLPRFNEELTHGEDLHFFIACAEVGGTYAYTDELTLIYNRHDGSAMSNLDGLHSFYRYHIDELKKFLSKGVIKEKEIKVVKKKVRKILFKSYLKSKRFYKAFVTIFSI